MRTFGGARLRGGSIDSVYLLYPGACYEIQSGTWAARTAPVADSLNTYPLGTTGPYEQQDRTVQERLWRLADASTDPARRPEILHGTRSIWCGKYDPTWVFPVGYPNNAMQILYVDTGPHAANYMLSMLMEVATERDYDFLYLIGGGGGSVDPIGRERLVIDEILRSGYYGESELLVSWTGSITSGGVIDVGSPPVGPLAGSPDGEPAAVSVHLTNVSAAHRAIYIVLTSDIGWSHEDGLWAHGRGQVFDRIQTSDGGIIYDDQPQPTRPEPPHLPYMDAHDGEVLLGTDVTPIISARVPGGTGELWHLVAGNTLPTPDPCDQQKFSAADLMLTASDPALLLTVPGSYTAFLTCPTPLPEGAYRVDILSNSYLNLRPGEGFLIFELRWYRDGVWTAWGELAAWSWYSGQAETWLPSVGTWSAQVDGADSIQARITLFVDSGASPITHGAIVDDLELKVFVGGRRPVIWGYGPPQSTFIDGTMTGLNCNTPPCWPGLLGSEVPGGTDDNVNGWFDSYDRFLVAFDSGIRSRGMGSNWLHGHGTAPLGEVEPQYLNAGFNPAFDTPRMIYRLFDPQTRTWSPFDSTELRGRITIIGADTLANAGFDSDWPPPDKLASGAALPGGFTINGRSLYSDLRFLPRGTRLQYYWKAVDILGNVAYDFGAAGEREDLPPLPQSGIPAPDIFEFDVLPRVYPPGTPGTLLGGRTDTPILYLDSSYHRWDAWGAGTRDPVSQALLGLGVRFDRYRLVVDHVGGHRLGDDSWWLGAWPNMEEYPILDLLASHYRIIIDPVNDAIGAPFDEATAKLLHAWWDTGTGANGGDRCFFTSGDNVFANISVLFPEPERIALMQDVFGISSAVGNWSGALSNPYPVIDDRFTGGGPGLGPANGFTYPLDGGCPDLRRFDGLRKIASSDAQSALAYPGAVADVAGVARMSEMDVVSDTDRNKALAHAFGIERIRASGIAPDAESYMHSGLQNRMRVLFKFLTSCRGSRNTASQCWPCPGAFDDMAANWAVAPGFQAATYGPLYPIQDHTTVTSVDLAVDAGSPRWVNELQGNFPNPFNPRTRIRVTAASRGIVTVRVFDVAGRVVRTLSSRARDPGPLEMEWDGKAESGVRVASGVYFYRVRFADGEESASRMVLLK